MSDLTRIKQQLHSLSGETKQVATGLQGFRVRLNSQAAEVAALIQGSATGVDRDLVLLLDAANRAVEQAHEALWIAGEGCRSYADQI